MTARDEVLTRVRSALSDVPSDADSPVDWEYGRPTDMPDVLGRFAETCADYEVAVERCSPAEVPARMVHLLGQAEVSSVVLPPGIDASWRTAIAGAGISVHDDDPPLSALALNEIDAVVTAAAVGIAETGTIILNHGADQGRRALTLVPDTHLVVVRAGQVVSDVPEAVAILGPDVTGGAALTWISGPSATSDIELSRVEGVHGPRNLLVLIVDEG